MSKRIRWELRVEVVDEDHPPGYPTPLSITSGEVETSAKLIAAVRDTVRSVVRDLLEENVEFVDEVEKSDGSTERTPLKVVKDDDD